MTPEEKEEKEMARLRLDLAIYHNVVIEQAAKKADHIPEVAKAIRRLKQECRSGEDRRKVNISVPRERRVKGRREEDPSN